MRICRKLNFLERGLFQKKRAEEVQSRTLKKGTVLLSDNQKKQTQMRITASKRGLQPPNADYGPNKILIWNSAYALQKKDLNMNIISKEKIVPLMKHVY